MKALSTAVERVLCGFAGFVILGSMLLAGLWLREKWQPKSSTSIQLSADDVLERLAQSDNYEIKCDKNGDGRIAFAK